MVKISNTTKGWCYENKSGVSYFKTHRFSDYERHTEVGKLIKKLHDIEKEHAEQYNKQTLTRNKNGKS